MLPNFRAGDRSKQNEEVKGAYTSGNLFMILGCPPGLYVDADSTLIDEIFR